MEAPRRVFSAEEEAEGCQRRRRRRLLEAAELLSGPGRCLGGLCADLCPPLVNTDHVNRESMSARAAQL